MHTYTCSATTCQSRLRPSDPFPPAPLLTDAVDWLDAGVCPPPNWNAWEALLAKQDACGDTVTISHIEVFEGDDGGDIDRWITAPSQEGTHPPPFSPPLRVVTTAAPLDSTILPPPMPIKKPPPLQPPPTGPSPIEPPPIAPPPCLPSSHGASLVHVSLGILLIAAVAVAFLLAFRTHRRNDACVALTCRLAFSRVAPSPLSVEENANFHGTAADDDVEGGVASNTYSPTRDRSKGKCARRYDERAASSARGPSAGASSRACRRKETARRGRGSVSQRDALLAPTTELEAAHLDDATPPLPKQQAQVDVKDEDGGTHGASSARPDGSRKKAKAKSQGSHLASHAAEPEMVTTSSKRSGRKTRQT